MDVILPTAEEVAAILAANTFRHPEKATATVMDEGKPVRLPLILGNPTGACDLPKTQRPAPAWNTLIAITMKVRPDYPAATDEMVEDCIVWPDLRTWKSWLVRWPALPVALASTVRQKFGGSLDLIRGPAFDEEPPETIAKALAEYPRALWRKLQPRGGEALVVIDAPSGATWRMFVETMNRRDAEHGKVLVDMAQACVRACCKPDGGALPFADVLDRWPGMAMLVVLEIAAIAGAGADVQLGEW